MGFRMAAPWKHPKTGIYWFRRGTPTDLLRRKVDLAAIGLEANGNTKASLARARQLPLSPAHRHPKYAWKRAYKNKFLSMEGEGEVNGKI